MRVREHKQLGSGQEMAEKYRINWDRHGTNISEAFRSLRKDEHLSDVTLACEEHQFQAHKVVLSAGSTFFEPGVELRPFFTKILAWTTFVHFSNPGAKNPCLDAILTVFPSRSSEIRMLQSNESLFVIGNENKPIL